YQHDLARTLVGLALLKALSQDYPAARQLLEQALPRYQSALGREPKNPTYREGYRTHRGMLAGRFLALGDHKNPAAAAAELAHFAYEPAEDAYTASFFVAHCANLAGDDRQLTEAKRKVLAQAHADRAMVFLRKAVKHGFKDSARLQHPAFHPLHSRDDFGKLLRGVDAPRGRP